MNCGQVYTTRSREPAISANDKLSDTTHCEGSHWQYFESIAFREDVYLRFRRGAANCPRSSTLGGWLRCIVPLGHVSSLPRSRYDSNGTAPMAWKWAAGH